jgi:hypothetical protein
MENLRALWSGAGLVQLETRVIAVQRTFVDFDDYWSAALLGASIKAAVATMTEEQLARLKDRVQTRLSADHGKPVTMNACANAIRGRVPH